LENVRLLLARRADPNIKNKDGKTPLYYSGSVETAKALLKAGAKIEADREGRYAEGWRVDKFLAGVLLQQERDRRRF
jgi:hypothetical protein